MPSVVSILPADSGFKVTWIIKDNQTTKVNLSDENYVQKSNEIFLNASEPIDHIKMLDCSEDITDNFEQTTVTFNFSKLKNKKNYISD